MKEVVVLGDVSVAKWNALLFDSGLTVEDDNSWPVPAVKVRGEASVVRGFVALLKAISEAATVLE
jgi:hypothetical protein